MKHLQKSIFLLVWVIALHPALAHPGGHYHKNDGTIFNTWLLKNGLQIKGNFSMGKDGYIVVEQEEGRLFKIPLDELCDQDRKLADFKIKKYKALNDQFSVTGTSVDNITYSQEKLRFLFILLSAISLLVLVLYLFQLHRTNILASKKWAMSFAGLVLMSCFIYSCAKTSSLISVTSTIAKTSLSFLDSAFAPYSGYVSTSSDSTYYYVSSQGIPAHNMMVGITNWQQQVPINQPYTGSNSWSIPLQPEFSSSPASLKSNFMRGAVAIAVNGIPIFNALDNRGLDAYAIGELDDWGGHCGQADDYHYHIAPLHLAASSGLKPIAIAFDGFAVYGAKEPDGTEMQSLDTCHGHLYKGVYHYHGTSTYPYMIAAMRGKVTIDSISSPSPNNQIIPQAKSIPVRLPTDPLGDASITAFENTGTNAYKLTYLIAGKPGYVAYSWNSSNQYTYILTDTAGNVSTQSYQRQ